MVVVPIDATQARQLGGKVYKIAPDPFKFSDAVLVGANEGYYGECKFQIDLTTPQYVKMDRSLFRGLFGKFDPSRGDLVLSKTGEVLGIMVNNEYCAVLGKITPIATLQCGDNLRAQQALSSAGAIAEPRRSDCRSSFSKRSCKRHGRRFVPARSTSWPRPLATGRTLRFGAFALKGM